MTCHFIPVRENFTAREVISSSSNNSPVSSPDRRRLNHSSDSTHHERLVHSRLARIACQQHLDRDRGCEDLAGRHGDDPARCVASRSLPDTEDLVVELRVCVGVRRSFDILNDPLVTLKDSRWFGVDAGASRHAMKRADHFLPLF